MFMSLLIETRLVIVIKTSVDLPSMFLLSLCRTGHLVAYPSWTVGLLMRFFFIYSPDDVIRDLLSFSWKSKEILMSERHIMTEIEINLA